MSGAGLGRGSELGVSGSNVSLGNRSGHAGRPSSTSTRVPPRVSAERVGAHGSRPAASSGQRSQSTRSRGARDTTLMSGTASSSSRQVTTKKRGSVTPQVQGHQHPAQSTSSTVIARRASTAKHKLPPAWAAVPNKRDDKAHSRPLSLDGNTRLGSSSTAAHESTHSVPDKHTNGQAAVSTRYTTPPNMLSLVQTFTEPATDEDEPANTASAQRHENQTTRHPPLDEDLHHLSADASALAASLQSLNRKAGERYSPVPSPVKSSSVHAQQIQFRQHLDVAATRIQRWYRNSRNASSGLASEHAQSSVVHARQPDAVALPQPGAVIPPTRQNQQRQQPRINTAALADTSSDHDSRTGYDEEQEQELEQEDQLANSLHLQTALANKKEQLLQQHLEEEMRQKQEKEARSAQRAGRHKAAIAAMKQKRLEEHEAQQRQNDVIIQEEMERVQRKKEAKMKAKAKAQELQRSRDRELTHRAEQDDQLDTPDVQSDRQGILQSSPAKHSGQSGRSNSQRSGVSKAQADLLAMLEVLESDEPDDATTAAATTTAHYPPISSRGNSRQRSRAEDHRRGNSSHHGDERSTSRSGSRSRSRQDNHLDSILTYLEEVEHQSQDTDTPAEDLPHSTLASSAGAGKTSTVGDLADAEALATANISTFLHQQRQLLDEIEHGKSREDTLKQLHDELEKQKELTIHIVRSQEDEMKDIQRKIQKQSGEFESRIKKLLSKNDQLVQDNTTLQDQCRRLLSELKEKEKKHDQRLQAAAEGHEKELKRQKDVIMAAENMKRERWKTENARKIKEVTVKGLEPEIQRLISRHKAELRDQAANYEAKIRAADERAGRRYIRELEELKVRLNAEKEAACAKERETERQRFERQLADEEQAMQQRTRRLYTELQDEKDKFAKDQHELALQFHEKEKLLQRSRDQLVRQAEVENQTRLDEQARRHQSELREQSERLVIEREAWKENFMRKQGAELSAKERILRQELKVERDKEIEMVVNRLESDMNETQEEHQRQLEARMNRLRDQHATEMREMERSERDAVERYSEMKSELSDSKAEVARQHVAMTQKDVELTETNKMLERLNKERDNVTDIVRQDFANRLVSTEEENKRIKTELAELTARHTYQLKRVEEEKQAQLLTVQDENKEALVKLEEDKQKEMQALHNRIKQAIAKKDETISKLKAEVLAANKKADHLNSLLQQQRKIMTKK
eukprot:scpid16263/ scgid17949/ 5-azacytidine-induced protein 1; Centrosomal protein of 131 kDa; Pre-acrosome localization protein 1